MDNFVVFGIEGIIKLELVEKEWVDFFCLLDKFNLLFLGFIFLDVKDLLVWLFV